MLTQTLLFVFLAFIQSDSELRYLVDGVASSLNEVTTSLGQSLQLLLLLISSSAVLRRTNQCNDSFLQELDVEQYQAAPAVKPLCSTSVFYSWGSFEPDQQFNTM